MKKLILSLIIYNLSFIISTTPVMAQQNEATSTVRDLVREKVKEKLENINKKPTAITGTLQQVTDSTLEIKTLNGKVLIASTSKETSYSRLGESNKKDIKSDDLVIGDYMVAMGYKNGKDILQAKRILTYEEKPTLDKNAVYGTVKSKDKQSLKLEHPKTLSAWKVKISNKTTLTQKQDGKMEEANFDEIEEGDKIVAVGTNDPKLEGTLTAKRIHVITTKARGPNKPTPTKKPKPTPTTTAE